MARIDAMGNTKGVLQCGALLGRHFTTEILEVVTGLEREILLSALASAVEAGLILRSEVDQRFQFTHTLTQQTAYDSLLKRQRKSMHQKVADAMATRFPDEIDLYPENFARHLEGADDHIGAIERYRFAGRRSAARLATVESVRSYRRALALVEKISDKAKRENLEIGIRRGLSIPLTLGGGFSNSELSDQYSRCRDLAIAIGDKRKQMDAVQGLWGVSCVGARKRETLEAVRELAQLADGIGDADRIGTAQWLAGATEFYQGNQSRALDILTTCSSRLPPSEDLSLEHFSATLSLRLIEAYSAALSGFPDRAFGQLESLIDVCEGERLRFSRVHVLCHICIVHECVNGDAYKVLEASDEIMQLSDSTEMQAWHHYGEIANRWARTRLGEVGAAEGLGVIVEAAHSQERVSRAQSKLVLVDALMCAGHIEKAFSVVDEVIEFHRSSLSGFVKPEAFRLKGELLRRKQVRPAEARRYLEQAVDTAKAQGSRIFERRALIDLATLDAHGPDRIEILARLKAVQDSIEQGTWLADHQRAEKLLVNGAW